MPKAQQSGFDPSILRHSGIWRAADETVLNKVLLKNFKNPSLKKRERGSNINLAQSKHIPTPGVEPGPVGWKPAILTVRPRGIGKRISFKIKCNFAAVAVFGNHLRILFVLRFTCVNNSAHPILYMLRIHFRDPSQRFSNFYLVRQTHLVWH
jgi:hypothetical protein